VSRLEQEAKNKIEQKIANLGDSNVYRINKENQRVREELNKENVLSEVKDFIFGKTDKNPLAEARKTK